MQFNLVGWTWLQRLHSFSHVYGTRGGIRIKFAFISSFQFIHMNWFVCLKVVQGCQNLKASPHQLVAQRGLLSQVPLWSHRVLFKTLDLPTLLVWVALTPTPTRAPPFFCWLVGWDFCCRCSPLRSAPSLSSLPFHDGAGRCAPSASGFPWTHGRADVYKQKLLPY